MFSYCILSTIYYHFTPFDMYKGKLSIKVNGKVYEDLKTSDIRLPKEMYLIYQDKEDELKHFKIDTEIKSKNTLFSMQGGEKATYPIEIETRIDDKKIIVRLDYRTFNCRDSANINIKLDFQEEDGGLNLKIRSKVYSQQDNFKLFPGNQKETIILSDEYKQNDGSYYIYKVIHYA